MENLLLLMAAVFCGGCSLLSFTVKASYNDKDPVLARLRFIKIIRLLWCLSAACVTAALILMIIRLASSDFSYLYVYSHSSLDTGLIYRISALWSGQEGSFLLWAFIIVIMGIFVLRWKVGLKSFGIYSVICVCICLMCFFTKPFEKMEILSADGLGLNEALKDPWMILHPPLVFVSYSAMAILFSCVALIKDPAYSGRILIWQRISLFFLGAGIISGSVWAYRALGWGGYWAWDPIENAALVPWLILCGYLHRKEARGSFACLLPFTVACFGVFLARSGILKNQSAHAYTAGNIFISIILVCFITAVFIFLSYSCLLKKLRSRQTSILKDIAGKLLFLCILGYAFLILIGTVSPLIFRFTMPMTYYNFISLVFAVLYSVLLLVYDKKNLKKAGFAVPVPATVLTVGIIIVTGSSKMWLLILLWVCLLPLSLWLISGFRRHTLQYHLIHGGILIMIIGAITSSALGTKAFLITNYSSAEINVEGIKISAKELSEKGTVIKTMPLKDILIKYSDASVTSQGVVIPYETKPLILLFWIGSFTLICCGGVHLLQRILPLRHFLPQRVPIDSPALKD